MRKHQTPLEKLLNRKEQLRLQSKLLEQTLGEDLGYIQKNMGSLALSTAKSMIFNSSKKKEEHRSLSERSASQAAVAGAEKKGIDLSEILSTTKEFLPIAWDVAKPFLITWGIRKAQLLLGKAFSSKKRKK